MNIAADDAKVVNIGEAVCGEVIAIATAAGRSECQIKAYFAAAIAE